jgi:hypothetical protein
LKLRTHAVLSAATSSTDTMTTMMDAVLRTCARVGIEDHNGARRGVGGDTVVRIRPGLPRFASQVVDIVKSVTAFLAMDHTRS